MLERGLGKSLWNKKSGGFREALNYRESGTWWKRVGSVLLDGWLQRKSGRGGYQVDLREPTLW